MSFVQFNEAFETVSQSDTLRRMKSLVDERFGLIAIVYETFREHDDPFIYNAATVLANTSQYYECGIGDALQGNGGAATNRDRCLVGAIGESLERYMFSQVDHSLLMYGSYEELREKGINCFDPDKISLYSDTQYASADFEYERLQRNSRISWAKCEELTLGSVHEVWYPAFLIFMPYQWLSDRPERNYGPSISTGQACGDSIVGASITGLLEAIERDAFVISWYNCLAAPRLNVASMPLVNRLLTDRFHPCPVDIVLNDITLDTGVPTVVATGVDRCSPQVSCTIGVAAGLSLEVAAFRAIIELAQDRFYVKYLARARDRVLRGPTFSHIDDFEKRVVLYNEESMIPALDFWRTSDQVEKRGNNVRPVVGQDKQELLDILVSRVRAAGGTVIRNVAIAEELAEIGFYGVKILIPEFQSLEGNDNARFLGCSRMYQVPVHLQMQHEKKSEKTLNLYPHPLP